VAQLIAIAGGGALGALLRFWVATGVYAWLGRAFPHGTLVVNVSGCLLMGLLSELFLQRLPAAAEYRAALLIGFLGAYTTFSTFAIETLNLFEQGSHWKAWLNILLSVLLCLVAVWVGVAAGRGLFGPETEGWSWLNLPWVGLAACALAFAVGFGTEAVLVRGATVAIWGTGVLVVALGLTVTGTTAYYAVTQRVSGVPAAVGWFALQAAGCGLAVWLGSMLGKRL
jgi:CrcB protein